MSQNDDAVGYCKPPKHSRFKPGQSGNPSGRPKAQKTAAAIVAKAASERVTVTENGKRRRTTKLKVVATQLVNQAAGGNLRASKMVLDVLNAPAPETGVTPPPSSGHDQRSRDRALIDDLARRLRGSGEKG